MSASSEISRSIQTYSVVLVDTKTSKKYKLEVKDGKINIPGLDETRDDVVCNTMTVKGLSTFGSTGQATISATGALSVPSVSCSGSSNMFHAVELYDTVGTATNIVTNAVFDESDGTLPSKGAHQTLCVEFWTVFENLSTVPAQVDVYARITDGDEELVKDSRLVSFFIDGEDGSNVYYKAYLDTATFDPTLHRLRLVCESDDEYNPGGGLVPSVQIPANAPRRMVLTYTHGSTTFRDYTEL